ncbi:MarR family winged helix-turn-helix transcriptional regulator [Ancylobacter lacus]|uniref:MarR family winged helix-turn-helix transcriptional regulator n=1 Tax=Ancylobacter lacus TaxID=2579970 RepID=UPI001BCCA693|nr:MarR family transcriptional regulator [Ancylobacter lacus]
MADDIAFDRTTPQGPVTELSDHLGVRLRLVANHVSHAFAAKRADREVTVAEWAVLRALYDRGPAAPSRLADEMGLPRGAITRLADRLIAKALLRREARAGNGRAQTLALTERGAGLVPELATPADREDADFFQRGSAPERETLMRLLRRMAQRSGMTATPIARDHRRHPGDHPWTNTRRRPPGPASKRPKPMRCTSPGSSAR